MNSRNSTERPLRHWFAGGLSAVLTAAIGLTLFLFPIGGGVTRFSFDLPFALRSDLSATNVVIIYLDEASHAELNQPLTAPWDRSLHAQLIEQLTSQGARAIVFDILFTDPSTDPEADARLAQAIKQSGRVVLGGNYQEVETTPGLVGRWEEIPYEPFLQGAVSWGNVNLTVDPDYGIRRFFPALTEISGVPLIPWFPNAAASIGGAAEEATRSDLSESRWINYYGPPGSIPGVSYFQALHPDGAPPGFFKDKIVFIGAQLSADFTGKGKDEFLTPYAYWGQGFAPGVEIHATAAENLVQENWLRRLPFLVELGLLILIAGVAGVGLIRLPPMTAVGLAFASAIVIGAAAHYLAWHHNLWFVWLIAIFELAVALMCAVIYNSLRLYVEKKVLEQSLAVHLSPALVKRVLSDPALRRRGGVKQEVSLLFTDIENFSRISETMHPDDLVNMLNRYFEAALACIHELDGTVMDLVGDAIFAIWNAPVDQPDHRERACHAALMLRERLVEFNAGQHGFALRTRVGLHSGSVCVGNIGSEKRFDYAAVGENTNLGSRLEGLNKHFGTDVLATRDIQKVVENSVTSRLIGHIQVKGFLRAVEVHELIGNRDAQEASRLWREKFSEGLQHFRTRRFGEAEKAFRETIQFRKQCDPQGRPLAEDGPSIFYLGRIAELRQNPPSEDWIGEVGMKEK